MDGQAMGSAGVVGVTPCMACAMVNVARRDGRGSALSLEFLNGYGRQMGQAAARAAAAPARSSERGLALRCVQLGAERIACRFVKWTATVEGPTR